MGAKQKRKIQNSGRIKDPLDITWVEKYDKTIQKTWGKIPESLGKILVTFSIFMLGISVNGKYLFLLIYYLL